MDFGKLQDISKVDFSLPADNAFTYQSLATHTAENKQQKIFIGLPIWANKEWVGKIYPTFAKEKDFLAYYSKQFNTIELNVTHYQIPTQETIQKWKNSVTKGFKFCPKFPQIISHDKQLLGCEALTEQFCQSILGLEENLGMSFLQLSPYFGPQYLPTLETYLQKLPKNMAISVEFRHPDWFSKESIWLKTCEILAKYNIGTVISDVSGRRDVLHLSLTNPILTLRFVGNELHPSDYIRADEWAIKIGNWMQKGLEQSFIFIHCGDNTFAPELAKYWINQLKIQTNIDILEPTFLPKVVQGTLF